MKKLFLALCFVLIALPAFAQKTSMGIAAIVNDDVITSNEVDARYHLAIHGAPAKPDEATRKQLRHQALEALIDEQVRLQEANKLGVMPDEKEIDEAFTKMAGQNNLTAEQFKKALSETPGMEDSLRRQIKTQMAWGNVVRKKVRPQVNVTENDINSALSDKAKNPAKVEFQVAEIFLKNSDDNMKLAQKMVEDLRSGKQRFSTLARQFSQGLEASKGGLLGWIPENRLEPVLDDIIKKTPAGQITDPVSSPRGIHIFLIREKRDILEAKESSQRIHLKQLIVPLPPNVAIPKEIDDKAVAQAKFFQNEAKDCKTADEVMKKINHPLSRDLGEIRLADVPSSAVSIVRELPIDKAADPIRTKDGYTIYMVCGRQENAEESVRDDVANEIGTDRLNRLQFRYYRDLRSSAYVDIKQN